MSTSIESPAAAESQAEAARAGLVSTLTQLRENLKPANVVDEVMSNAKVNVSAITDRVWDTAKKNPFPALMIGAGLAMIFGVGTRSAIGGRTPSAPPARSQGPAPGPEFRAHLARTPSTEPAGGSVAGRAAAVVGAVSDQASGLLDTANDRFGRSVSRGAAAINDVYSRAKRSDPMSWSRQNVSPSLSHLVEEQPLILAAIGVAIGAAIGAALPHTRTEDAMLGETSGSVKAAAQDLAQGHLAQIKSAASHAVDDIKQTVADHGITTDNLSGLAQDVGGKAKSAVYEAGLAADRQT